MTDHQANNANQQDSIMKDSHTTQNSIPSSVNFFSQSDSSTNPTAGAATNYPQSSTGNKTDSIQFIQQEMRNVQDFSKANDQNALKYFSEKIPGIISMFLAAPNMATYPLENLKEYFKFFTVYLQTRSDFIETMPDKELFWIFKIFEPSFPFYFNFHPEITAEVFEELLVDLFPPSDGTILKSEFKAAGNVNCFFKFMLTFLKDTTSFFQNVLKYLSTPRDYDRFFYISNSLTKIIMYHDTFDHQYVLDLIKIIVEYYERLIDSKNIKDLGKAPLEAFFKFNMISDLCLLQKLFDIENLSDNTLVKDLLRKELKLATFLTSSQNLEKRVLGMKAMNDICNWILLSEKYNEDTYKGLKRFIAMKTPIILEWLEKINIFQIIFGENIHEAILKKSSLILIFLYMNNKLTLIQIDFIWRISQDKHEAISASILNIFSDLISSFSIEHAMYILKIINEIPVKDVTDATIKILDSFSNNKYLIAALKLGEIGEKKILEVSGTNTNDLNMLNVKSSECFDFDMLTTDQLTSLDTKDFAEFKEFYLKILWKFSSECSYYAGMSSQNISKARKVLAQILLKPVFKSELEKYVKKCIYGLGSNHMLTTHLSVLDLIIKNIKTAQAENISETLCVFGDGIKDIKSFLVYLERKYALTLTVMSVILDIKKDVMDFTEEIISIQNIVVSSNQNLNLNAQEIVNIYEHATLTEFCDKEKMEVENEIEKEKEKDDSLSSIASEMTELEKTRRQIFKDFLIAFSCQITDHNFSFKENYDQIFLKLKLNFMNQNYYAIVSSLLEFLKTLIFNSLIQLNQTQIEFLFQLLVENAVNEDEMNLFFSVFSEIIKFQNLTKEKYISDELLHYILFDLVLKLNLSSLPYSGFSLFQQIFFLINSHNENLTIKAGKISDVKDFTQLVGFESIWTIYLEAQVPNVSLDSQTMLVSLIAVLSKREDNKNSFLIVFDKIFTNLSQCYQGLINKHSTIDTGKDEIDYEEKTKKLISLLFVANSTRQKFEKPKAAEMITLQIRNSYFNNESKIVPLQVPGDMPIKDLKIEIIDKVICVGDKEAYRPTIDESAIFLQTKGKFLKDKLSLKDYKIESGANIMVFKGESGYGDYELDEQTIAEGVQQLKFIFEYDDEVLKRCLKKCGGNAEEATFYLTDESHVNTILQEIQEDNAMPVVADVQTKFNVELFNEEKISLLLNLLDFNIPSLNTGIWQLLSAIKYPVSLVSILTQTSLINFKEIFDCSKPNRLLLYLKLLHCLVFGDKFFINVSKLEEKDANEWKMNMIINDGTIFMLQAVEKIINILRSASCSTLTLTYIQCLQFLSKWVHFYTFATAASLSYNKDALSSLLKQVIHNRPHGVQIGVPKDAVAGQGQPQGSAATGDTKGGKQNKVGIEEYEKYFEEEPSNAFFFKLIASNIHVWILTFIQNCSSLEFMQMNFSSETEVVYLNFLEVLIIFNEVNPESFRETIQSEYENSVIMNLLFVEKNKSVRKVVENFFVLLSQYQTAINLTRDKASPKVVKSIREILSMHILNNYKRIYSGQVYEEFYNLFGHILLYEKEFSTESFSDFNVNSLSHHIMKIIFELSGKNDIDLSEIEQEQLSGNIYLFQCLCANHENVVVSTLDDFSSTTGINVISFIYNCLFTIQDDNFLSAPLNNYERIKLRYSNKNLRHKAYTLMIYLIRINESFRTVLTENLLCHHKNLRNETSKTLDLDIPFRVKKDKFIGMTNYGATCYLNSLVQQLYMMPSFRESLYSVSILDNLHIFNDLDYNTLYQLQLVFANLSGSLRKYHTPLHFIQSFTHAFNDQPISTTTQQDSDEFLNILTDKIEKVAKIINRENFLEDSIKGKISNEIISLEKDFPYYSESEESIMRITLDIKNKRTIEEALDLFVREEILEGENKYYCEKHDKKIAIMKRYSIKQLSKNVIIHLKRFEFDYNIFDNVKLNDYIEFPHELDFKNWMRSSIYVQNKDDPKFKEVFIEEEILNELNDPEMFKYTLTGILVHSGSTIQHGHYFSFIMDQETGRWYRFDDRTISEFNVNDIKTECFGDDKDNLNIISKSQNAYLLFYTKKDSVAQILDNHQAMNTTTIPSNFYSIIRKENIQFLKFKTYIDHDYYNFIRDFLDYTVLKNKTVDKLKRKEQSMTRIQVLNEQIANMANEVCAKSQVNLSDPALYHQVKDIFIKCTEEVQINGGVVVKKEDYSIKKKLIKLAMYYYLEVIINQGDKNKISTFANFIRNLIDIDRTAACWVLKTMEKNPELFMDLVLVHGMSEVREGISRIVTTSIFAVQQDEKKYLKDVFKTLQFVEKTDTCSEYYYFKEESRSCLMRFMKQNLYEKFDSIRQHFGKYKEFLGIIFDSVNSIYETVELGHACNLFKTIIYFIMNNQGKFKTNFPTMGGKGNEPSFSVAIDILSIIILSSVTKGIKNLQLFSKYSKFTEVNKDYLHLPQDWEILLEKDVLVNSILRKYHSTDSTVKICHHLAWGDLDTSLKLIENINIALRDNFRDVTSMTNLIHNTWGVLEVDDAYKHHRTSAIFLMEDNANHSIVPIFDFLFSYRDEMPLNTILCLKLLGSTIMKFPHVYDYVYKYSLKLKWIFYFLKDIQSNNAKKDALVIEATTENCSFNEVFSTTYDMYCINLKLLELIDQLEQNFTKMREDRKDNDLPGNINF